MSATLLKNSPVGAPPVLAHVVSKMTLTVTFRHTLPVTIRRTLVGANINSTFWIKRMRDPPMVVNR